MFLTLTRNLSGQWYILLADNSGPIQRYEYWNYDDYQEAVRNLIMIGKVENIRVIV